MTPRFPLESLATPALPRLTPDGVFDAFGWCASERLSWGRAADRAFDTQRAITSANPPEMVFVFRERDAAAYLPRELAALHAPGMGFVDETALAPWAIDDATDSLFEHRARPSDCLWLVAQSLASLFWGLHDWAHFHNHGPFERRAWTELQCDVSALAWLEVNRRAIGIDEAAWERARREVVEVAKARFDEESERGEVFDAGLLDANRVRSIAAALER
jgi:hypothetical protein